MATPPLVARSRHIAGNPKDPGSLGTPFVIELAMLAPGRQHHVLHYLFGHSGVRKPPPCPMLERRPMLHVQSMGQRLRTPFRG